MSDTQKSSPTRLDMIVVGAGFGGRRCGLCSRRVRPAMGGDVGFDAVVEIAAANLKFV